MPLPASLNTRNREVAPKSDRLLEIINRQSLIIDAMLIPGLALGVLTGKLVIHRIPQKVFEKLLYLFSAIAGIRLVFF